MDLYLVIALLGLVALTSSLLLNSEYTLLHGQVHRHVHETCVDRWRVPGLCWCNRPAFLCFRTHCGGEATACKSNLKNIATALEMYSADNQGRYPPTLAHLVPTYLKSFPTCPHPMRDTYSQSYLNAVNPDGYTVFCAGHWHSGVNYSMNYPQYTSTEGLLER